MASVVWVLFNIFKEPSAADKSQEPSQQQKGWTKDVGDAGRGNKCIPCVTTVVDSGSLCS